MPSPFAPTRPLELANPGPVHASIGLDGVTGMPVFIFTCPPGDAALVSTPVHPALAECLTRERTAEGAQCVFLAPPGWTRISPPLAGSRLAGVARDALEALGALHAAGLAHGGLQVNLLVQGPGGAQLLGAGMPWVSAPSSRNDLRDWAALVASLAAPRALDQLPSLAAAVKTAQEPSTDTTAAALIADFAHPEVAATVTETPVNPVTPTAPPATPAPAIEPPKIIAPKRRLVVVAPSVSGSDYPDVDPEQPVVSTPTIQSDENLPEPDEAAAELGGDPAGSEPGVIVRRNGGSSDGVIRIGWQDDDSWRPVKAPEARSSRATAWRVGVIIVLVALVALLVVFALTRPRSTTAAPSVTVAGVTQPGGIIVTFRLQGGQNAGATPRTGRLTAMQAPAASGLKAGDVLAAVPGPVLFPVSGAYRLRVNVDGFQAREFTLQVTHPQDVLLQLKAAR